MIDFSTFCLKLKEGIKNLRILVSLMKKAIKVEN